MVFLREKKKISSCEIKEAFLEEMISELRSKVEAVFECEDIYSSRGGSISGTHRDLYM